MNYPIFKNPREYIAFRKGNAIAAPFRRWSEWRSLDRCLKGLDDIGTVCDCPCGPGRLFPYWKKRGFGTIGVDLSDEMVEAARLRKIDLDIPGKVLKADAFCLHDVLSEKPDLVTSIRFFYYFDRPQRIQLLRSFTAATRKYVLVQYKTAATLKGRMTSASPRHNRCAKRYCCYESMVAEMQEAGLVCLRVVPKGHTSDRVFVLAQKPDGAIAPGHRSKICRPRALRNSALAAAVILLFVGILSYYHGIIGDIHERRVERIVRKYQDGNDHFYVAHSSHLKGLRTNEHLTVVRDLDKADGLAKIDSSEAEDSFFLVKEEDLRKIGRKPFWERLSLVAKVAIGPERFVLLTTEKDISSPAIREEPVI